jgi:hypothetical protein
MHAPVHVCGLICVMCALICALLHVCVCAVLHVCGVGGGTHSQKLTNMLKS